MNLLTISVSAVFAVLAAVFAVWLVVAILDNLKRARRYRQDLEERLSGMRLAKMLSHQGVDRGSYLHTQRILDVEQQMTRCGGCAQTARCDALMAGGADTASDFCANDAELQTIRRQLDPAA